jgi:osmotically-inducible protein OsmY
MTRREVDMTSGGSFQPGAIPEHTAERTDNDIARKATQRIAWSVQVPDDTIEVKVHEGWVTLTGFVDWRYQKLAVESLVHEIHGVCGITNQISVRPQPYDADVREKTIDLAWTWQHGR